MKTQPNGSSHPPEYERSLGRRLIALGDEIVAAENEAVKDRPRSSGQRARDEDQIHLGIVRAGRGSRRIGEDLILEHGGDPASGYTLGQFCQDVRGAAEHPATRPHFDVEPSAGPAGANDSLTTHSGYLAPLPISERVWQRVYETGAILDRCADMPASPKASGVRVATVDEESRVAGERFGGLEFAWLTDGDEIPASHPKFGAADMPLRKSATIAYATEELIADSALLDATLMEAVPKSFAYKFENAIVNGIGGGIPIGIMNSPAKIVVDKEDGQAAGSVVWTNIKKMWSRLWTASKRGNVSTQSTVWLVDNTVDDQLYSLSEVVGTGGGAVFQPANAAAGHLYPTLFGRPVIPVEYCQLAGTEGDIILTDFSQYLVARKPMRSALSFTVQWVRYEGCFRFVFGVDGQPGWHSPVTPANGGETQSPIITLATRA